MNPWISIWTEPKKTIAQIVSINPNRGIWFLAWVYGFLSLLNIGHSIAIGTHFHLIPIILFCFIVAPVWGMILFCIWSWLILIVGKILKGRGDFSFVRAAFAWSCVPLTINIVLWMILLSVFGNGLFQAPSPKDGALALLTTILIVKVVVAIWSLVIYINALAEVQKYSIARSIGNIVLSWVVIVVAIALFWMGIAHIINASLTSSQAVFNLTLRMQL